MTAPWQRIKGDHEAVRGEPSRRQMAHPPQTPVEQTPTPVGSERREYKHIPFRERLAQPSPEYRSAVGKWLSHGESVDDHAGPEIAAHPWWKVVWLTGVDYFSTLGLSFAKIASGNMSLGCNAFITMMQTAELRNLKYPSDPRDLPRKWALFVEPQMRPRPVVVSEIRSQGSPQMPGVHNHEMVQAVSAYGTD